MMGFEVPLDLEPVMRRSCANCWVGGVRWEVREVGLGRLARLRELRVGTGLTRLEILVGVTLGTFNPARIEVAKKEDVADKQEREKEVSVRVRVGWMS
jgi:hypothetical protein